jgi:hypothetical protein
VDLHFWDPSDASSLGWRIVGRRKPGPLFCTMRWSVTMGRFMDTDDSGSLLIPLLAAPGLSFLGLFLAVYLGVVWD